MDKVILSFVIIEYYSIDDISKCIYSISDACNNLNYEIIVSSNSCYCKERQDELIQGFPMVRWSFNPENGGFAYGMNQGLRLAKGDYLTILNPDVKFKTGLSGMIQFMKEHPEVGAIAPEIKNAEGDIQDSCREYVTFPGLICRTFRRIIKREKAVLSNGFDYSSVQTVDWVIGAFIMVRRNIYQLTLGLDDGYFMYAEDLDWCTRIRKSGFEIVYFPEAKVEYEGSRSARKSFRYFKIFLKSHLRYWRKNGVFKFSYPKRNHIIYR